MPVGTGDEVERLIRETNPSADVVVASNPEFLREGAAIRDFKFPDRIVVGTSDERGRKVLGDIYRPLSLNQAPLMFTARRTAELIKYAANAFLATKITFINEIADLVRKGRRRRAGSRARHRARQPHRHEIPACRSRASAAPAFRRTPARWSRSRRTTTCSCASSRPCSASTTTASARWRARLPTRVGGSLRGKTVAVLGLTFKPDTDDMREAPSIPLVTGLLDMGAKVRAHDPVGMEQARKELPDIEYCDDPYACVRGADAMVIVTEWVQYRALDLERLKSEMAQPVVVDLRNIYRPEDMAAHGFTYESVGRASEPRNVMRLSLSYPASWPGVSSPSTVLCDRRRHAAYWIARASPGHDDVMRDIAPQLRHAPSDRRGARRTRAHARRPATPPCWWRRPAPARPRGCRWRCSMRPG